LAHYNDAPIDGYVSFQCERGIVAQVSQSVAPNHRERVAILVQTNLTMRSFPRRRRVSESNVLASPHPVA